MDKGLRTAANWYNELQKIWEDGVTTAPTTGAAPAFRGVLIGCGFFARNHMHGWADAPGAEIVGVCDIDPAKAAAFARDFGARPFTDAAAMLAELSPDFVDVATTVATHRPLVELALAHGALTICQKPFADQRTKRL